MTPQETSEGVSEVSIPQGVDDRVEGGVEVPHPEERRFDGVRPVAVRPAEGGRQVPDEERHPAEEEGAHDDAERLGRLVLPTEPLPVLTAQLPVEIPVDARGQVPVGLAVQRHPAWVTGQATAARRRWSQVQVAGTVPRCDVVGDAALQSVGRWLAGGQGVH